MHLALVLTALLWQTWNASTIVHDRGTPVFIVESRPFYVYGAAFFYERTPVAQWRSDLERYRAMGINTIDLYLIWNWHEPDAHTVDFDGHTNPQRNLHKLFVLIHELGFKVIVRPGPVIRNEWRNGGYPDWLLEQARIRYAAARHPRGPLSRHRDAAERARRCCSRRVAAQPRASPVRRARGCTHVLTRDRAVVARRDRDRTRRRSGRVYR